MIELVDFENDYIVPPDTHESKTVATYLCAVAKKVLPDWDWDNHPVSFLISQNKRFLYLVGVKSSPEGNPVVIIGKEFFDYIKNEAQVAFALGYQAERWFTKDHYKPERATKPRDGLADISAAQRMIDAGYDWQESIVLLGKLHKAIEPYANDIPFAIKHGLIEKSDVPNFGASIKNIQQKLSHMTHRGEHDSAKVTFSYQPIPDEVLLCLESATHVGYLAQQLPADFKELSVEDKAHILGTHMPPQWDGETPVYTARNKDFL